MLATAIVLPTVPMAVLAVLHVFVMRRKARHEEKYLLDRFGPDYARYCAEVGRFWPNMVRRAA
jgi:protein-S-isoprenylcysteine O-methyltransferase Ste14